MARCTLTIFHSVAKMLNKMPIIIGAKLQINFQTQLKKIRRVFDVAIFLQYFIYALY